MNFNANWCLTVDIVGKVVYTPRKNEARLVYKYVSWCLRGDHSTHHGVNTEKPILPRKTEPHNPRQKNESPYTL